MRDDVERGQQLRADKRAVEDGAMALRKLTNQARYAGTVTRPEVSYGLASVLDVLALKMTDLDPELRRATVEVARDLSRDWQATQDGQTPESHGE